MEGSTQSSEYFPAPVNCAVWAPDLKPARFSLHANIIWQDDALMLNISAKLVWDSVPNGLELNLHSNVEDGHNLGSVKDTIKNLHLLRRQLPQKLVSTRTKPHPSYGVRVAEELRCLIVTRWGIVAEKPIGLVILQPVESWVGKADAAPPQMRIILTAPQVTDMIKLFQGYKDFIEQADWPW